jgi:hypothetical protein
LWIYVTFFTLEAPLFAPNHNFYGKTRNLQLEREIPTLVAMRTKKQSSKYCPPAFAGMTHKQAAQELRRKEIPG